MKRLPSGKITEAAPRELLELYRRGYQDLISFPCFLEYCACNGVKILPEDRPERPRE